MIAYAAYTAAKTPNAFQWSDNPKIAPFRGGGPRTHLTHSSLDPQELALKTAA